MSCCGMCIKVVEGAVWCGCGVCQLGVTPGRRCSEGCTDGGGLGTIELLEPGGEGDGSEFAAVTWDVGIGRRGRRVHAALARCLKVRVSSGDVTVRH
jgi:hypothetical protein